MNRAALEPVFLTGGTGYLGGHLRKRLAADDWQVTLLVRPGTDVTPSPNESVVRGDVTAAKTLDLSEYGSVLHLAARTDVDGAIDQPRATWTVNADGTLNVLEAARSGGVERFLYTSTSRVYGAPVSLPVDELHPTDPVDPYGASKLAGDKLTSSWASTYDLSTVVVRPFNSFGTGQPTTNVAALIADQIRSGGPVELRELSSERDFLYAPDVASGILTALVEGRSGEAYNVGRGEAICIGELARLAVEVSVADADIIETGTEDRAGASIQKNVADSGKLRALGWEPEYSVRAGLREFLST